MLYYINEICKQKNKIKLKEKIIFPEKKTINLIKRCMPLVGNFLVYDRRLMCM